MLDYMEYCLLRYYEHLKWNQDGYFSRLLDFRIPQGFYLTLGKSVSPELKGCYTIGIPNVRSVGFLVSSIPVDLPPLQLRDEEVRGGAEFHVHDQSARKKAVDAVDEGVEWAEGVEGVEGDLKGTRGTGRLSGDGAKDFLLYGRIFEDMRLEALYTRGMSPRTIFVASGVSFWRGDSLSGRTSKINLQLQHARPEWCGEISYGSDDHAFGVSGLYKFGRSNWSAGSELYYTAKENSGGLGARYKRTYGNDVKTIVTFLANPMMGHLASAYTTTVAPGLNMATRYTFNVYSYEADVSVGFEYAPRTQEQLVKAKLSLTEGLAVKLETRYRRALVGIGFTTQFGRNPRQSLGIEMQIS
ncbi:Mitochondrial distribution and morphology protein 10 [Borealophlyctis nickersoniae]|nr:Mitochondrial distribution and morphology protein 10 [Borealophlyctis nickersoniae]